MSGFLRQSTASQARLIGPFVDDTDFKTAETGLTIANTDILLRANGTTLSNKNSGGGTHQANGTYSVTWDATDTANVGELFYSVKVAGALQVFGSYTVLEEAVYDALFAASAPGYVANAPVNVAQFGGSNLTSASGIPEVKVQSIANNAITANSINSDAVTAAKLAADVTTEVQSGLATSAALSTTDGKVDAIKTKTDQLTFTVANQVDANAESINATTVNGNGTAGNLWRG